MRFHSLYAKFLLGYLIFGLLGFITISTFSSEIIYNYLLDREYGSLYAGANLILFKRRHLGGQPAGSADSGYFRTV